MSSRGFLPTTGYLLAALSAAGISAIAVFECTQSTTWRVVGIVVRISTFRAMMILDAPASHSTANRVATAAVGLPICWPVFDLFRYALGLGAFWVPSRLMALGGWRIAWVLAGIWYMPIMVVSGASLLTRARGRLVQ